MSNMSNRVLRVALSAVWLFLLISSLSLKDAHALPSTNSMILLLPDDIAVSDPRVASWIDAAGEEGLKVDIMTDLAFLQLGTNATLYHGFILPDQVHMKASDLLVSALQNYVTAGGNLMLV